jgi:hypothetical protein
MGLLKVVNNRESRVVLSKLGKELINGTVQIDELVFEAGANNVDESRLAEFRMLPTNKVFFDSQLLVVEGPVGEAKDDHFPKYGGDISKLKSAAALKVIKGVKDPRVLHQMIRQDGRPEIRAALIARHVELQKDEPEEPKDD